MYTCIPSLFCLPPTHGSWVWITLCCAMWVLWVLFPVALIHGPDIPGSYAILLFTALDLASVISHTHKWVLFLLLLHPFIISEFISPLISSSILGTYQPGEFIFQYPIIFAFSYCSEGSQGKNTEMVCHSLLQWTTFCQTSPLWPIHLEWPHRAWLSFTELDKANSMWSMWLDWLVFRDYGFSMSALWCPLATPTALLGFLLPWTWGIYSQLLQPSTAAVPYLGRGVSPHHRPSWPCGYFSANRQLEPTYKNR